MPNYYPKGGRCRACASRHDDCSSLPFETMPVRRRDQEQTMSEPFQKTFDQTGTFEALYACQQWLSANGYSYSSTCRDGPVGVMKGDYGIAKWRNLTREERAELHGTVDGDFREGPLVLRLKAGFGPQASGVAA
ncbi:hypothetical protein IPC618_21455 [Pseudomonas aeruginosa]|uniref:hypothetical protein n=1 Tax=Pseudomonas TaxID=286 RepID=UPI000313D189|nr:MULTISPECIES: hypothetical protein [Pseudomonas]AMX90843.1 hypothetical protein A4W92_28665 [Pseudomonas aeruginosa]KAA2293386.1 hypothetical protein F1C11_34485 [Pseudomonas aeruginosa]KFL13830.1 hypothetical protein DR97_5364 [Pseudomonas aeruginosa]KSH54877.1 hypothetical protein AO971_10740 [Pseudomonas aeruginosa]KSI85440.1 hypothetical protein AO988_11375 [Pseudomonas aeruginosa]